MLEAVEAGANMPPQMIAKARDVIGAHRESIRHAIAAGVRYIDTSESYENTVAEKVVGCRRREFERRRRHRTRLPSQAGLPGLMQDSRERC